jgi:2-polyprenyl-3-methyl-5-hydroxy-6-metoxy-1,4-benzoquinol methylase
VEPTSNRYWSTVDPALANSAHTYALELLGQSKRVLELGPAAGHVTRALVERSCDVVAIEVDPEAAAGLDGIAECLVGDLNDPSMIGKAAESGLFDAVLAGDVLEHLVDPVATLRACREVLVPGGYVVVSLPNIAHVDVALSLVAGRFPYRDEGLLDRTHLRFFTRDTIGELFDQSGLTLIDIRRVVVPAFGTELGVDRSDFAVEVVDAALAQPDAETYQFVVRAVRHDGDAEVARLAARCIKAEEAVRQAEEAAGQAERSLAAAAEAQRQEAERGHQEADRWQAEADHLAAEAQRWHDEADRWQAEAEAQRQHVEAIFATRTMRTIQPFRNLYARLRRQPD